MIKNKHTKTYIIIFTVLFSFFSYAGGLKKNQDNKEDLLVKKIIDNKGLDFSNIILDSEGTSKMQACGNGEEEDGSPFYLNFGFEVKSKFKLKGITIPAKTEITICNDKIYSIMNSSPEAEIEYLNYKCKSINFEENEKNMCRCTLSETTRVNEIDYEAGSTIYFKNNKAIGAAFIDSEYMTKLGLKRGSFRFDDKGRPTIEDEKWLFCWYTPKDKPVTLETYKKSKK